MTRIIFHTIQLDVRGTCTSLFMYAHYNETLLGNESVILTKLNNPNNETLAVQKFKKRFKILSYDTREEIQALIQGYDILYNIKFGKRDDFLFPNIKNVIHSVFDMSESHGEVFAGVSETLAQKFNKTLFVPHMIGLEPSLNVNDNLREKLNIPNSAIVYGRHGGTDTFDLQFVKETIVKVVQNYNNIYFIFVNTPEFCKHPQVIFLEKIIEDEDKNRFINTCDACIHAQSLGETFGLSIGEFSVNNKPIITYGGPTWNNAHKEILKDRGIYYFDRETLYDILINFNVYDYIDIDINCYKEYSPENVMKKFKEVFIDT